MSGQAPSRPLRVAVVGATGIAGQQFLAALDGHPWFTLKRVAASERSAGKPFGEALKDPATGATRWYGEEPCPEAFLKLNVELAEKLVLDDLDLVFTALESDAAKVVEPLYAKKLPVVSTASAFRYEEDVPIFLPGINPDHAKLIERQRKERGFKGFVTPGPNCTTVGLAISLKPLFDAFGVQAVLMTSLQAVSGAGRSPGVLALDITDNLVPYIPKEEEKVEKETRKILGALKGGAIEPAGFRVSATCTRVNVLESHTECVSVALGRKASLDEVKAVWRQSYEELRGSGLPTAPREMIHYTEEPFRPQPRLDRDREGGMTTTIGRLREDAVLANGIKYVLLSHNTKMGAAKGAILTAEWLIAKGAIQA
ncbi:MAG: aspartate-semialdehyde dehydrogenase [Planctomycetota bacterium]|nr:aspartate-semialdehyde dehydrogenase [Planctomycetota bacterium]